MARNCSSKSSLFQDSYLGKSSLEDKSRLSELNATLDQQPEGFVHSKHQIFEQEKITELPDSTENHCCSTPSKSSQLEECTHNHDETGVLTEMNSNNNTPKKVNAALTFSIPMGNSCARQPPKKLLVLVKARQHKVEAPTLKSLNDKQMLAEKRRKQQIEKRLQRIHTRQEAAIKHVDILLQQRALAMGMTGNDVKRIPSRQILATAHPVAENLKNLTNQLGNDLSVNDTVSKKQKGKCPENETRTSCPGKQNTPHSVSFTVEVPVKTRSKKPVPSAKQKKVTTAEDLEEKQRQAEERRNKRREWRVRRTRENREALTKMAKDIEKFKNIQLSTDTSPASMKQSKETVVLAEKIASGFDRLSNRYHEDLQTTDNFFIHQPNIPYMGP